jgi:hypothetical protein
VAAADLLFCGSCCAEEAVAEPAALAAGSAVEAVMQYDMVHQHT